MSLVSASRYDASYEEAERRDFVDESGAQSLLVRAPQRPNNLAQAGAVVVYLAVLGAVVTVGFKAAETPIDAEQVIELAAIPVDEPQPEETPPPEQMDIPEPPPPLALDPIAPIEEVKPPPPKPIERPKPEKKVEKRIERTSAPPAAARAQTGTPAVRAPVAPSGASASAIANQFHACMQRAAANAYPESQAPRTARISYHASFSAGGSLTSYSISSSGNGAFDAVANRLGGRCGSVAAPGKPVSLSGSLTFSP
jgi:type IV secretory pathway VirB10-like protein